MDQNVLVGVLALLGAGVTGFYMTRLMLMTFFTEKRWSPGVHPHESPSVMTGPLVVLAALSLLGGVMLIGNWIVDWLAPVTGAEPAVDTTLSPWVLSTLAVVVVAGGVFAAWWFVGRREVPREAPQQVSWVTRAGREEVYGNQINDAVVVNPGRHLVGGLLAVDRYGVDGTLTGGPVAIGGIAGYARRAQNGFVRSYALSLLGGALIVVLALLAVNLA
jgi:NADH-quinone oxidoreductase subunit L